jgi:hypothetical protein
MVEDMARFSIMGAAYKRLTAALQQKNSPA